MASDIPDARPAVISAETATILDEFRRFRHLVRNVYTFNLVPEKMENLISILPTLWAHLCRTFSNCRLSGGTRQCFLITSCYDSTNRADSLSLSCKFASHVWYSLAHRKYSNIFMSDIAVKVENLSKRYRIGAAKEQHDTFMSAMLAQLRHPGAISVVCENIYLNGTILGIRLAFLADRRT